MNTEEDEFKRLEREAKRQAREDDDTQVYKSDVRAWVGLTDEEWEPLYDRHAKYQEEGASVSGWGEFARAIEAKLKEKNNG
jgi:hypothetical protein